MNIELEHNYLKIKNKLKPKKGRVLISQPFSSDDLFKRSIVLLTEHNKKGSVGFILNKPIKAKLSELLYDFEGCNSLVSIGGPVHTDSIFFIQKLGDNIPGSHHICQNLYWGGDIDVLRVMAKNSTIQDNKIRFFVGYSGWSPNQLKDEIENNYWVVSDFIPQNIFINNSPGLWNFVVSSLGNEFKVWSNTPKNPIFN